jgi:DNA-binding HxlR family transcriptional regulator
MTRERAVDEVCGIAQAAAVMGDWWNLLVVREVVRGHRRFDELVAELGVSRKVLTERLGHLTEHEVLQRVPYSERPPRYEYELTERGRAFLPVLVSMQDWADRWLLGDGELTATADPDSAERHGCVLCRHRDPHRRDRRRSGRAARPGRRRSGHGAVHLPRHREADPAFPRAGTRSPAPSAAPWRIGCSATAGPSSPAVGAAVHGVSTQRPEEQAAFAEAEKVPFPLLSDVDLQFAAALRLPTIRIAQQPRLKRLIAVVDADRVVRHAIFPVLDIPAAVDEALHAAARLA